MRPIFDKPNSAFLLQKAFNASHSEAILNPEKEITTHDAGVIVKTSGPHGSREGYLVVVSLVKVKEGEDIELVQFVSKPEPEKPLTKKQAKKKAAKKTTNKKSG